MDLDEIAGYRIGRALGAGSVGAVWLARDLASGRPVVIKRVPASSVTGPEVLRRDLALARGLDHDHVVGLVEVRQAEREWLIVSEYAAAGTLTDLLQRRGPLSTGELVTLLGPIAQALAAAHQVGLTHGHLGGGDILLGADGRPMLADLGLRVTAGDGDQPAGAADDLAALGRLARQAGGDPVVFTDALFAGEGTSVAAGLLALAQPEPIGLGFGDPGPGDPGPGDTGPGDSGLGDAGAGPARPGSLLRPVTGKTSARRRALAVVAGGVVAAGVLAGLGMNTWRDGADQPTAASAPAATSTSALPTASQSATPAASSPAATPVPTRPGRPEGGATLSVRVWTATLTGLDDLRAEAFARLDATVLDAVYQRGSAPWRSDRALLASYREIDTRVHGLHVQIQRVAIARRGRDSVVLRVVDRFAAATAVDRAGRRTALPAGRPTTRLITMTGSGEHWHISGIVRG